MASMPAGTVMLLIAVASVMSSSYVGSASAESLQIGLTLHTSPPGMLPWRETLRYPGISAPHQQFLPRCEQRSSTQSTHLHEGAGGDPAALPYLPLGARRLMSEGWSSALPSVLRWLALRRTPSRQAPSDRTTRRRATASCTRSCPSRGDHRGRGP